MRAGVACLLLLALRAGAQETLDKHTLAGMDAEVSGDWVAAVEAFERARNPEKRDAMKESRLRNARERGRAFWVKELNSLMKAKREEDAARAAALARLVDPKHHAIKSVIKRLEKKGISVPELPPPGTDAVAAYPNRSPGGRLRCWTGLGGTFADAEAMIDRALDYLVAQQEDDGRWNAAKGGGGELYDAGCTALSLLALLARGPEGLEGKRGEAARDAVRYLKSILKPDGVFGTRKTFHYIYNTSFATEALAEYAVLTGQVDKYTDDLEKARDYLVEHQNPGAGWRYEPKSEESDTSVSATVLCAFSRLKRAGLDVPKTTRLGAAAWFKKMTDPNYGQIGYNFPGGAPARPEGLQEAFPPEHSQAMTAAGALGMLYTGQPFDHLALSLALVQEMPPSTRYPDLFYWQYGARLFQAAHGRVPRAWYAAMVDAATSMARDDGAIAARGVWGRDGGVIYSTAMTVLALAVPYREPPVGSGARLTASDFHWKRHRNVSVPAAAGAIATGIYVDAGVELKIRAVGRIVAWEGGRKISPDGVKKKPKYCKPILKSAPFACLLGRVGPDGKLFRIKMGGKAVRAPDYGQLYLLVNDQRPEDGSKAWKVSVQR